MELRELKSTDLFLMFKILRKIGFTEIKDKITPDTIKKFTDAGKDNGEDLMTFVGFNVIMEVVEIILSNLPSCEKEIYDFVGKVAGVKSKEISELPMSDFTNLIVDILLKEEFKDFFKAVSRLFNQMN